MATNGSLTLAVALCCVAALLGGAAAVPSPACYSDSDCKHPNPCVKAKCSYNTCDFTKYHPAGYACDDGNACTTGDKCNAYGKCESGAKKLCPASTTNPCKATKCNKHTGDCEESYDNAPDGTKCDDGDACTHGGTCQYGSCVKGAAKVCPAPKNQCKTSSCNSYTGKCVEKDKPNGTPCNDGNACTTGDSCQYGSCVAGASKKCYSKHPCKNSTCNKNTGACEETDKDNGAACNDGNPCTTGDKCSYGQCVGASKTCPAPYNPCMVSKCSRLTGQCIQKRKRNGSSCNDGNACTTDDKCWHGKCKGTKKTCYASNNQCMRTKCDRYSGQCVEVPKRDGSKCNDGDACTDGDKCYSGKCKPGHPKVCAPLYGQPCYHNVCNKYSGACEKRQKPEGSACSDGNKCTTGDKCSYGVCQPGTKKTCYTADQCKKASCDPATGGCKIRNVRTGTKCDDGDASTYHDKCNAYGICKGRSRY